MTELSFNIRVNSFCLFHHVTAEVAPVSTYISDVTVYCSTPVHHCSQVEINKDCFIFNAVTCGNSAER